MKEKIIGLVKQIAKSLTKGDYASVINHPVGERLTTGMVNDAISEYPGKLTLPPDESYNDIEVYTIEGKSRWIAEYFLWADNEQSELMIKVVIELHEGNLTSILWDIYVP